MTATGGTLDPGAYARLVERVEAFKEHTRRNGNVDPVVPLDGPPRVAPPRLRVVVGDDDREDTWRAFEVATIRDDWHRATQALGRHRRGARPDQQPALWRCLAAWFAMRRTGMTRLTFREFFDSDAGALEVSDLDDPTPGTFGHLADYYRDARGHDVARAVAAAVVAALELEPDDDEAQAARVRRREHEHTDHRGPPAVVDVLTECVLTAAPPRPRARATAPA